MKKHDSLVFLRLAVLIIVPCAFVLGCWFLFRYGSPFPCQFYRLTGLYCPGCGSGRAAAALLHGHFSEAFGYNPLLLLLGIPFGLVAIWEYLAFTLPGLVRRHICIPQWLAWSVLGIVLAFWFLRNIPLFSFLAP